MSTQTDMIELFPIVFFFKQKTAYEMRISDWSSDVCSSDLRHERHPRGVRRQQAGRRDRREQQLPDPREREDRLRRRRQGRRRGKSGRRPEAGTGKARSEEHTSELQSLMRISYAVFCFNKKKWYPQSNDTLLSRKHM